MYSSVVNRPWPICLSSALFFFYAIFQMSLFNSISSEIMAAFQLNPIQLGNLSSLYFYADALFLLPIGLLLDAVSTRFLLLSMMSLSVVSLGCFGLTHSVIIAGICRAIWGVGNAVAFLGCLRLASLWFAPNRMAFAMGVLVTVGMFGGVTAQAPFVWLVSHIDWRTAILISTGIGCIMWLVMLYFIKDKAQPLFYYRPLLWPSLKQVFNNGQNWLCGVYACLLNLPVMLLDTLWGNLYLTQAHAISLTHASIITSIIFLGLITGSPLIGILSDKMSSRRKPMLLGAVLTFSTILIIIYLPGLSWQILALLFFLLGFLSSSQVISYPMVAESNPAAIASTATSIVAILINLTGALVQPFFGCLMKSQILQTGTQAHAVASYQSALLIMPIAFAVSCLIALVMKDTISK